MEATDTTPISKRVTVTLGEVDQDRLEEISRTERVTKNDAIRRALATEEFIVRTLAEGRKIMVQDTDGTIREVEFVK